MSSTPWFRFYNEAINDPKLKRISMMTKQPKALIVGVWSGLLCLASQSPDRGKLLISEDMPYMLAEILDEVGIDFEIGEFIIDHLIKFDLINLDGETYQITHWDKRQFKTDSNGAERVRKHRAKQQKKSSLVEDKDNGYPKRYGNVTVTPPDTESDTDTEEEKEKDSPTHEGEQIAKALATVCEIDIETASFQKRRQVKDAAAAIGHLGGSPDQVEKFLDWWWGDTSPSPLQVSDNWLKFTSDRKPKERKLYETYSRSGSRANQAEINRAENAKRNTYYDIYDNVIRDVTTREIVQQ